MRPYLRVISGVMLLVLLMGLTACGKDPGEQPVDEGQGWVCADRYEGAFSDQGFYYENRSILYYLDTASGVSTALCSKAGCLHDKNPNKETCEAYIPLAMELHSACFWNGSLYYIAEGQYGIQLYRCNATGTERTVAAVLGTRYTKEQKAVSHSMYAVAGGYFYYYAVVTGSVWDEEQLSWVNRNELSYISRVDLRTGQEEILVEERENTLTLCAVKENAVLFTVRENTQLSGRDPGYQEALKELPVYLKCWDGETGQQETLFEKTVYECRTVRTVLGNKVYYSTTIDGSTNTYTYDLATGEDVLFAESAGLWFLGGGYVRRKDGQSKDWYLYRMDSGEKLPVELDDSNGLQLINAARNGCVLQHVVVPEGGGKKQGRYYYVTYEALSDGLQEKDVTWFYTVQYST